MESLAEMIRQGIEAANEDLKRENDARLLQEVIYYFGKHFTFFSFYGISRFCF